MAELHFILSLYSVKKLNIQKTKIMASGPITSWQIDGETMETVRYFILGSSKITADGDCSHEIKRCLLLRRKVMANLDSILKSRDITLPTKVHLVMLSWIKPAATFYQRGLSICWWILEPLPLRYWGWPSQYYLLYYLTKWHLSAGNSYWVI